MSGMVFNAGGYFSTEIVGKTMALRNPEIVIELLKEEFSEVDVGPYHLEYINSAGKSYHECGVDHLAKITRPGDVVDVVDINSPFVRNIIEYYGAEAA